MILNEQRELLVVLNADGKWELPGGGWEHHESMQESLHREVAEELGGTIAEIGDVQLVYQGLNMAVRPAVRIVVPVTLQPGELVPGDGMLDVKYVTQEEFRALTFEQNDSGILLYEAQIWR